MTIRTGNSRWQAPLLERQGCPKGIGKVREGSPRVESPERRIASLGATLTTPQLAGGCLLFDEVLVPRAREMPAQSVLSGENPILSGPLTPGQLVGYLDAIAVGIVEIDAHRDAMVGDAVNRDVLVFEALVNLL